MLIQDTVDFSMQKPEAGARNPKAETLNFKPLTINQAYDCTLECGKGYVGISPLQPTAALLSQLTRAPSSPFKPTLCPLSLNQSSRSRGASDDFRP